VGNKQANPSPQCFQLRRTAQKPKEDVQLRPGESSVAAAGRPHLVFARIALAQ
jgi:hypothetical protein